MIFLVAILENEGKLLTGIMGLLLKNQFCLLLRMFIFSFFEERMLKKCIACSLSFHL